MDPLLIDEFCAIVGRENASTSTADRYVYASDASVHQALPELVLRPSSAGEVQAILKLADERHVPIVPRGAGTSLAGNAVPVKGGIVLDLKRMNRIIEISLRDQIAVVEPGVVNDELNAVLAPDGFFFPPTPASGKVATIGGMIGNNASGMRALKYGTTRDAVLGMKVVLPGGELINVGTRTIKQASGLQLDRLFIGSEGTLGVVVEAVLKVIPVPKSRGVVVAVFPSLEMAGEGVANVRESGLWPSAIEIMDRTCIDAVNKAYGAVFPSNEALLLIEVDGHPAAVRDDLAEVRRICEGTGAVSVESTTDQARMDELWKGRKGVLPALSRAGEEYVSMSLADDMDVPLSRMAETVKGFQEVSERTGVIVGTYGHAGDGNLHTKILFDPTSRDGWDRAKEAVDQIYALVFRVGGTTSGEHGVGISKASYLREERSDSLATMMAVKRALDPNNIMNPGKVMQGGGDFRSATALRYKVVDG